MRSYMLTLPARDGPITQRIILFHDALDKPPQSGRTFATSLLRKQGKAQLCNTKMNTNLQTDFITLHQ